MDTKNPKKPNSDKMTNLELWRVDVNSNSYEQKWTSHCILQHIGFYSPTENPCVMMRENLKTQSSEYIVICQDELYIAKQTPEAILNNLQDIYKAKIHPDVYLGSYFLLETLKILIHLCSPSISVLIWYIY